MGPFFDFLAPFLRKLGIGVHGREKVGIPQLDHLLLGRQRGGKHKKGQSY
jgi:hypothetical protein